jgi:hypothetical protein
VYRDTETGTYSFLKPKSGRYKRTFMYNELPNQVWDSLTTDLSPLILKPIYMYYVESEDGLINGLNDFTNYHGILNSFQLGYLTNNYDDLIRNSDGTFNINKFSKYVSINNTTQVVGSSLNALSYFESANDFYNKNYIKGTTGAAHNTIGIYVSKTPIGALGWFLGTCLGKYLTTTELYNRILFGENSSVYRSREHNWYKSKILKND